MLLGLLWGKLAAEAETQGIRLEVVKHPGAQLRLGGALSVLSEGLRAVARYRGGPALRRSRLPLSPPSDRRTRVEPTTRASYPLPLLMKLHPVSRLVSVCWSAADSLHRQGTLEWHATTPLPTHLPPPSARSSIGSRYRAGRSLAGLLKGSGTRPGGSAVPRLQLGR